MREIRQSGSVRGVRRNPYPYRDCVLKRFRRLLCGTKSARILFQRACMEMLQRLSFFWSKAGLLLLSKLLRCDFR
jgi:hypothetical protein